MFHLARAAHELGVGVDWLTNGTIPRADLVQAESAALWGEAIDLVRRVGALQRRFPETSMPPLLSLLAVASRLDKGLEDEPEIQSLHEDLEEST